MFVKLAVFLEAQATDVLKRSEMRLTRSIQLFIDGASSAFPDPLPLLGLLKLVHSRVQFPYHHTRNVPSACFPSRLQATRPVPIRPVQNVISAHEDAQKRASGIRVAGSLTCPGTNSDETTKNRSL